MKKKLHEKKNVERNWATAQLSCEKKQIMYCNLAIVLQPCNCIARERAGKKKYFAIVFQKERVLYCNTIIVLQVGKA